MKSFLTSFKSTEPKKTTWRQDWSLDQPFQNLTCYYTTQLPLFHRHPTQSIISQSISESLSALQGYTVWVDCNLVQIIQLQMPPYIRLNSKHLYKIWSEREAVLMCKNVLKWMVSNFISPMLRLLPSFEGRGGGVFTCCIAIWVLQKLITCMTLTPLWISNISLVQLGEHHERVSHEETR